MRLEFLESVDSWSLLFEEKNLMTKSIFLTRDVRTYNTNVFVKQLFEGKKVVENSSFHRSVPKIKLSKKIISESDFLIAT